MIKTYKFTTKKNNNTTFIPFNTISYEPNYSEIIDNIILGGIKKKNDYLFGSTSTTYIPLSSSYLKVDDKFIKAANFLANYKKNKKIYKTIPYELGKMYTLSDGTPIVFYDDEIQIGFDTFKYADLSDLSFLNGISDNTKKAIINISININLL
jgi:hypothetical protein